VPPVTVEPGTAGFAASYFKITDDLASLDDVDFEAEPATTGTVDALQYIEVTS